MIGLLSSLSGVEKVGAGGVLGCWDGELLMMDGTRDRELLCSWVVCGCVLFGWEKGKKWADWFSYFKWNNWKAALNGLIYIT